MGHMAIELFSFCKPQGLDDMGRNGKYPRDSVKGILKFILTRMKKRQGCYSILCNPFQVRYYNILQRVCLINIINTIHQQATVVKVDLMKDKGFLYSHIES